MKLAPFNPFTDYSSSADETDLTTGLVTSNLAKTIKGLSCCLRRGVNAADLQVLEDAVQVFLDYPGSSPGGSTLARTLLGTHSVGKSAPLYGTYKGKGLNAATLTRVGCRVYYALCSVNAYTFGQSHGPDGVFVQHQKHAAAFSKLTAGIRSMRTDPVLASTPASNSPSKFTGKQLLQILETTPVKLATPKENYDRLLGNQRFGRKYDVVQGFPTKAKRISSSKVPAGKRMDIVLESEGFTHPGTQASWSPTDVNAWHYHPLLRVQVDAADNVVQMDAGWRHTLFGKLSPDFIPDPKLLAAVNQSLNSPANPMELWDW